MPSLESEDCHTAMRHLLRILFSIAMSLAVLPAQVVWERAGSGTQTNGACIVFDSQQQRFLAVEGVPVQVKAWNGTSWQPLVTAPYSLMSSSNYCACYDTLRHRLVIGAVQVNGTAGLSVIEWDGTTWTRRTPVGFTVAPITMIWDPVRQKSLFGGNLLYEWDGTTITNLGAPPNSTYHIMFNPMSGRPLLPGVPYRELRLDNTWVPMPPTVQGVQLGLAFHDPVSNTVQVMPSSGWGYLPEVWDGMQWRTVNVGTISTGAANLMRSALDPVTNEILGVDSYGTYRVVRGPLGTITTVGTGCPGALGLPTVSNPNTYYPPVPVVGKTIAFQAANILPYPYGITYYMIGFDTMQWGGFALPLDASIFGMPGCHLYQSIDAFVPTNFGYTTLAIPGFVSMVGLTFHVQAMGLELMGASGPGTCTSPSFACTIGVGW